MAEVFLTDIVDRINAYDAGDGRHCDKAGASAYELLEEAKIEIVGLRSVLWPFAMKELKGTSVCADDFKRAGAAMPFAPDHTPSSDR